MNAEVLNPAAATLPTESKPSAQAKGPPPAWLISLVISALVGASLLAIYHRFLSHPPLRIGLIDLTEVYRQKEKQLIEVINKPGAGEREKAQAIKMADDFGTALPAALAEVEKECKCLVLVRSAVGVETAEMEDLTPSLRKKLGWK